MHGPPLLMRGEHVTEASLKDRTWATATPMMHNIYAVDRDDMHLSLGALLDPDSIHYKQFAGHLKELDALVDNGKCVASMGRLRSLVSVAATLLLDGFLDHEDPGKRPFGYLLVFAAHINRHVYEKKMPTPESMLRFSVHTMIHHLLCGHLSGEVGGKPTPKKTVIKYHTESCYHADVSSHAAAWQREFNLPFVVALEEAGEHCFDLSHSYQSFMHRQCDLVGERAWEEKLRIRAMVAPPRASKRQTHWSKCAHIPYGRVILHHTVWALELRDIAGPNAGRKRRRMAAVGLRRLLRSTARFPEEASKVSRNERGQWVFEFGEEGGEDIHLCFDNAAEDVRPDVFCYCKGQCKASGKNLCPCVLAGRSHCSPWCHNGHTSGACGIPPPARSLVFPPPGVVCFCDPAHREMPVTCSTWCEQNPIPALFPSQASSVVENALGPAVLQAFRRWRCGARRSSWEKNPDALSSLGDKYKSRYLACLADWRSTRWALPGRIPRPIARNHVFGGRRIWRALSEYVLLRRVAPGGDVIRRRYALLYKSIDAYVDSK
jgi:hypothetical protein